MRCYSHYNVTNDQAWSLPIQHIWGSWLHFFFFMYWDFKINCSFSSRMILLSLVTIKYASAFVDFSCLLVAQPSSWSSRFSTVSPCPKTIKVCIDRHCSFYCFILRLFEMCAFEHECSKRVRSMYLPGRQTCLRRTCCVQRNTKQSRSRSFSAVIHTTPLK